MPSASNRGNVLFLILIAVALFAVLSYALTKNGSGKTDTSKEKNTLHQSVIDNYTASLNVGIMRLRTRGCATIDFSLPASWSASGSKSCFMFHPNGGQVVYQDFSFTACKSTGKLLTALSIGEGCDGLVYAGISGGNRIYTTYTDAGIFPWNNGSINWFATGSTSSADGVANTNILVAATDIGAPYLAANVCRALGSKWYFPAWDELTLLYTNKTFIGNPAGVYWASRENATPSKLGTVRNLTTGGTANYEKNMLYNVRCVRRD